MGFRSKIKGRLKGVLGKPAGNAEAQPSPTKFRNSITDDSGGGNLRGEEEDVPWYLKYEDNDGWESTDATLKKDEDDS